MVMEYLHRNNSDYGDDNDNDNDNDNDTVIMIMITITTTIMIKIIDILTTYVTRSTRFVL